MKKRSLKVLFPLLFLITLNSCIGLSMDIQMRRDGSGRIVMEYRISNMAEYIGRLDGNENWPILPVGRADWERSLARMPGLSLVSFSSNQRAQDTVNNVTLEYDNAQALVKFLDPSGERSSSGPGRIDIVFHKSGSPGIDASLLDLARQVSAGYKFELSFSAEENSRLTVTDGEGKEIPPPSSAEVVQSGRKVSMSIGIMDIITRADGLGASINW
jgi:hypothetical protein